MRFSPKSIFVGIVAVGLPIAATVGWNLAIPAKPPAAAGVPAGGAGAFGAAPKRDATTRPDTPVRYPVRPAPSSSGPSVPASPNAQVTGGKPAAPTAPPSATPSSSAPPVLTLPPVPTPTDPGEPSESASASPSPSTGESSSADPSGH